MEAKSKGVGEVLSQRNRWDVPIYQRHYAWEARDADKHPIPLFYADVTEKANERLNGKTTRFDHYMGALIFGAAGKQSMGVVPSFDVVDGQQRLTTFQLFFAAIRALALDLGFNSMADHLERLILNGDEHLMERPERERFKLCPTRYDQADFEFLMESRIDQHPAQFPNAFYKNGNLIQKSASKPLAAWHYFYDQARKSATEDGADSKTQELRLDAIWRALAEDFKIVTIELSKDDDAQVIFASLNGRGEPLSAMDLVRNDLWHRAKHLEGNAQGLYDKHWSKFENPWWSLFTKQGRMTKPRMELFLANFIVAQTGAEVTIGKLFPEYRHFSRTVSGGDVQSELESLTRYAPHYAALVDPGTKGELAPLGEFLRTWDVTTAHPLALFVAASGADEAERQQLYSLIQNYVVRRALCGLSSKNFNNSFLRMLKAIRDNGVSAASIITTFTAEAGESYKMPTDDEIRLALPNLSAYKAVPSRALNWVLRQIELASRDKFDADVTLSGALQIEHVFPQGWRSTWPLKDGTLVGYGIHLDLSNEHRSEIAAREAAVHTLGNLALLTPSDNAQQSNSGFETKKLRLTKSLLKMNHDVGQLEAWDVSDIQARSSRLAEIAIKRWPSPSIELGGDSK